MIAFIKHDEPPRSPPALKRARQLVASTLMRSSRRRETTGPAVSPWLAWLFTAWVAAVTIAYGLSMLGWLFP